MFLPNKWVHQGIRVSDSEIEGRGVFAVEPIAKGECVFRWGGRVIDVGEYDETIHNPRATTTYDEGRYLTDMRGGAEGADEFLNHSCDPNIWLEGKDAVTVLARRDIKPGEELVGDFATWNDSDYVFAEQCMCKSAQCRGTITGKDWKLGNLQQLYAGHFLPFLTAKIG